MKVTLQNLTKKFPSRNKKQPADVIAVNDFTFEIPDGVLLGLLGPSGCGKTTLLNIIGGLTLEEPAADLAAVVAIASSYLDKPVPDHMAAIGEVGLSGEIRSISHLEQRLTEVHRLGFTQCMVPARRAREIKPLPGLELLPVQNISQALRLLVGQR